MSYKDIVNAKSPKEFINGFKKKKDLPVAAANNEPVDKNIVFAPELPRVNVVPAPVFEKYQIKGITRKFVFAGIGIAAAFMLAYIGGIAYMGVNQAQLATLNQQQSQLNSDVQQLQPYQAYQAAIDGKRKALDSTTSTDVNMGTVYGHLINSAQANNVGIKSLQVTQADTQSNATGSTGSSSTAATANGCINPDPFSDNAGIIGCVQVTGSAPNKDAVNGFLHQLEAQNAASNASEYKNPFISSFTSAPATDKAPATSQFTATISFTQELYSKKYSDLSQSLDSLIAKSNGSSSTNTQNSNNQSTTSGGNK